MKNHTTYETADLLKESGFPQPEPEAGQFWYLPLLGSINGENPPYCINFVGQEDIYFSRVGGIVTEREHVGNRLSVSMFLKAATFAPTAADILHELPVGFCIVNFGKFGFGAEFEKHEYIRDQNPQEAAAQAFLNLKAKQ